MSKKQSKHTKKYINRRKKSCYFIAFFIAFFIIMIIINNKNKNTKMRYESTQLILNNVNITDELVNPIIIENNQIYLSLNDIKKYIDGTIYKEDSSSLIITTCNKKISTILEERNFITINGSNVKVKDITINKNEINYLAISELESVYDYDFNYYDNTNVITIDSLNKKLMKAYAIKNLEIKGDKGNSKIIDKVKKGNWLIFISEENGFAKVRTQDGILGYVKKDLLSNYIVEREDFLFSDIKKETTEVYEYNLTKKDISTYEKRFNIINFILQEAIKNDSMYVKIIWNKENNFDFERFKIEVKPMLQECGIIVEV